LNLLIYLKLDIGMSKDSG